MNGREPFPELRLRPVADGDVDGIVDALKRLSRQSLYQRYFTAPPDPTRLVTAHLAVVDHRDHEALVVLDGDTIVAIAQWDRSPRSPDQAEVAMVVGEEWQHRGLGRALVRALAGNARRHGVGTLIASVLTENRDGRGLAHRQQPASVTMDGPQTTYRFELAS